MNNKDIIVKSSKHTTSQENNIVIFRVIPPPKHIKDQIENLFPFAKTRKERIAQFVKNQST